MIFVILFLLIVKCDAAPGHYECGVHGRFEYCIDDFPGCVVGCHCYPGYYFDTDSKICEPNTKLTQDYRRHMTPAGYNLQGGNAALVVPAAAPPHVASPETAASPDDPADTGDLSDWLYNQFFKTIESQVVNKTDDEPLRAETRRSGGASIEPLLTRRHKSSRRRKSRKRGSRKKKMKKSDESDEKESSSESDSSDSGSDDSRGDLGSWERFEWGSRPNAPSEAAKDGSQREIVMYSKKPKPPLPSFIFLPNMGTAFYPPIGLPAPPIPMFPMVPIPPIVPGQPPYNVAASTQESTTIVPTMTTLNPSTPTTPPAMTTKEPTPPTTPPPAILRSRNFPNRFQPKNRNKPQQRQVFKPSPVPPPVEHPMKQYHQDSDYDALFMGDTDLLLDQADKADDSPDFKYISELIHRDNNESTSQSPTIPNPAAKYDKFFGIKPPNPRENRIRHPIKPGRLDEFTRRRFDPRKNGEDDSYYSVLGKQIAKLIRGLDSADVRGADLKIEPTEVHKPGQPFFSETSYAARTYWERFVRSPLSLRLNNFTKYVDLIASNENLFKLENQVEEATSAPALSWLELENVINTMGTIRNHIHDGALKNNHDKLSNVSLNVSLLPRFSARRNFVSEKPKIKTNGDNTAYAAFNNVMEKLNRYDRTQRLSKEVIRDATQNHTEPSKTARINSVGNNLFAPIQLKPNIQNLRSFASTIKPKLVTPTIKPKKRKKHEKRAKVNHDNDNMYYFNEIEHKPHLISIGGDTTFVKSNKYFFDHGSNYQFENWGSVDV